MHDAQIRVAIAGAGGRMGRQLIQAALQMDGVALGAAPSVKVHPCWAPMRASWQARARQALPCRATRRR